MGNDLSAPITDTQDFIDDVRDNLVRAFASFEAIANLKFIEVQDTEDIVGDIRILFRPFGPSIAIDLVGSPPTHIKFAYGVDFTGSLAYSTYEHEIAHMLGFKHPFEINLGNFPYNPDYRYEPGLSIATYEDPSTQTITQKDSDTLQCLYGAPGTDYDGIQARFEEVGITLHIL